LKKLLLFTALFFMALTVAMPSTGHTAATLSLNDGINPVLQIQDNQAGDLNPALGAVNWSGSIGTWVLNVTTGVTKPLFGSAAQPSMDLNSVNISAGAGTLQIMFSEIGFTAGPGATASMDIGGTARGGNVTFTSYFDNNNGLFSLNQTIGTIGPLAANAFSGSLSNAIPTISPYSLTELVTVNLPNGGIASFDASLNVAAPIPSAGLMMGSGILLCLLGIRRKITS
jgi:hypothetical protein